jgi:ferredoxin-type protein NapF
MDGGRRAFLRGALLTRSGRVREARRHQALGPPPPWHANLPLEAHCPACTHPCMTACEPGIIRLHPADHTLAGVPWLDFQAAGCTFCGACVEACPIDDAALERSGPLPRIGEITLNRTTCLAWNGVICQSCLGRCEVRAITLDRQRRVHADATLCNGCGMCVTACPAGALSVMPAVND